MGGEEVMGREVVVGREVVMGRVVVGDGEVTENAVLEGCVKEGGVVVVEADMLG